MENNYRKLEWLGEDDSSNAQLKNVAVNVCCKDVSDVMEALSKCTQLCSLEIHGFSDQWHSCVILESSSSLPKSITSLTFDNCVFTTTFDWNFLVNGNVRDLFFGPTWTVQGWGNFSRALKNPGCSLRKLGVGGGKAGNRVDRAFHLWQAVFTLLLARNKPHRKLKRLPVEMFRLVGMAL